ncbi:hypothetical protein C2S51_035972 [Perilla frutescens var. frutescens]|nr:hypothetical protein C2S51_035972 [Perilla frutescens var. frutescens]
MRKHRVANLMSTVIATIWVVEYCLVGVVESQQKTFSAEYGPFDGSSVENFVFIGDSFISKGALQLTPDTANTRILAFNSGRVLLRQPFRLWEDDDLNVASFNTWFLFNIYEANGGVSQGLAFLIARDLFLPSNSNGPFLGLTSSSSDGSENNKLVAVEFDTFKDYDFDPDDNHVGIDINSVRSIKNESLTRHNINLTTKESAKFHNVWVDYDGLNKVIDVYMAEQAEMHGATPHKPVSPILSAPLNLRDYVDQYSYMGFSASTGYGLSLNCVLRWNLTVHHFFDPQTKMTKHPIIIWPGIVLVVGLVVVLGVAAGFGYRFYKHKTSSPTSILVLALKNLPGMPREFRFRDLKKATANFNEMNKLGQGGFGVVYRGLLVKENVEIAVKRFSRDTIKSQSDFMSELTVINRLRHKHLVKLLGWCHKSGKLLLVYEYMPNSSLDQHLFVGPNKEPLSWNLRLKIITGVASALHYLHNEYDQKVIHRDLKASNIMLDHDFNARLGDFGLAKVLDNEKTSYAEAEGVMGTKGYIAPECLLTGKATRHSDIYAFGAVLLEVVCGQRPGTRIGGFNFLVDWVWMLHKDDRLFEAVDRRLGDDYVKEEAERLLLLGLACSHPNGSERPNTQDIIHIISGTMPVPAVPPSKPAFLWAAAATDLLHADHKVMDMNSVNTISITLSNLVR